MKNSSLLKIMSSVAETLTAMCIYYLIAVAMIVSADDWGISIFWFMLLPIIFTLMWQLLLKKPKNVPVIVLITGILFTAQIAFYIRISDTNISFRYAAMIAVGAGMGIGLPLNYATHDIKIQKHLMTIDYMVICTAALFLVKDALSISNASAAAMVLVLILDICTAALLRISENDSVNPQDASKAVRLTICCAAAPVSLTILLSLIFSNSGKAVRSVFEGLGYLLIKIWTAMENFLKWIFGRFAGNRKYEVLEIEEMPSIAAAENEVIDTGLNVNPVVIGIIAACIIIIALILIALFMRKKTVSTGKKHVEINTGIIKRKKFNQISLWGRFKAFLHFELTVIKNRNTAAGLMVYLERRGRMKRQKRLKSETMRAYIARLDKENQLSKLADALDKTYYAGNNEKFTAADCSKMRRYIRRVVQ